MNSSTRNHLLVGILIIALYIGVIWLIFHPATHADASTPALAYVECGPIGCQTDLVFEGQEPIERFCSIIAIETPSNACNILGTMNLYRRLTWLVYAYPSPKANTPALASKTPQWYEHSSGT